MRFRRVFSASQRFRERFLEPRHHRLAEVVEAACTPDRDPALIAELIAGSMWYRLLVSGGTLDGTWVGAMVALLDQ